MTYTQSGRIIKMTGGLYTVRLDPSRDSAETPLAGHTVDCRARGNFRHEHTTPLVGDLVSVQYDDTSYDMEEDRITPSIDGTGDGMTLTLLSEKYAVCLFPYLQ